MLGARTSPPRAAAVTTATGVPDADGLRRAARFGSLPEHVRLADTSATQEPDAPPDPTMSRDADTDWLLRNAG